MSVFPERHRFKWNSNEINRLYIEYELRELDVNSIAHLHKRTVFSILNKLADEDLIQPTWIDARGYKSVEYESYCMENNSDSDNEDGEEDSEYIDELEDEEEEGAEEEDDDEEEEEDTEDAEEDEDTEGAEEDEEDEEEEDEEEEDTEEEDEEEEDEEEEDTEDAEEEEEEEDEEDEEENVDEAETSSGEFDPYSVKQKTNLLTTIINNIKSFFYKS
jgi:hypothetical protein